MHKLRTIRLAAHDLVLFTKLVREARLNDTNEGSEGAFPERGERVCGGRSGFSR
jgi:hypothetical protein